MSLITSPPVNAPTSGIVYSSDFCEVKNWLFDFSREAKPTKGYNDALCIVYVKRGDFLFDLSTKSYDMHSGHLVIDKPNYEYSLRPSCGECSIFNFTEAFYHRFVEDFNLKQSFFFSNENILSLLLRATPETEYLYFQVVKKIPSAGKLEIDNLVLELLKHIVSTLTHAPLEYDLSPSMRTYHLRTIETAKEYMNENFALDISLTDLADYCCVSPFHFCRVFKRVTDYSPHQYLQNIRLKHGEMMLKNGVTPVSEVSFQSGFNSVEYFATAFKQKYGMNPTTYRKTSRQ